MATVMKRPAMAKAASKPPPAKKTRVVDPLAKQCNAVLKGLHGVGLPYDVAQMLNEMLPIALMPPKEERDKYQASIVEMAEQVFTTADDELVKSLKAAQAAIVACDESATGKEATLQAAEKDLEVKDSQMQEEKRLLANAALDFRAARGAVDQAQADLETCMAEARKAEKRKEQLQAAEAEYLKPLSDGVEDMSQAQAFTDALIKVLLNFGIDETMTIAMPKALVKPIAERGAFDTMLISQVSQEIATRVADFQKTINEAEPTKAAKEQALQRAQDTFEQAKKKQLDAAKAFKARQDAHELAQAAFAEAAKAVKAVGPERRGLMRTIAKYEKTISVHRDGPMAAFMQLRDRAPAPAPEPEEVPVVDEDVVVDGSPTAAEDAADAAEEA